MFLVKGLSLIGWCVRMVTKEFKKDQQSVICLQFKMNIFALFIKPRFILYAYRVSLWNF